MAKRILQSIVLLSLSFWPLSLFLANTPADLFRYATPVFFIALSFVLFWVNFRFYLIPLLFIPFFDPKLAVLPGTATLLEFMLQDRKRVHLVLVVASLFVLLLNWKGFWGQTIFVPDYQKQQEVVGKTYLYPSVFLARIFQNKPRIYWDKFTNNFFALTDPNNYFFGFHPREIIIDNQNLRKYPFLSLVFMVFGLYYLGNNPHKKFILVLLASSILSLSILTIFDRNDFILWLPLFLILIDGVKVFDKTKWKFRTIFYIVFLVFTITEFARIFLQ